jgi:hypothetical protein
MSKLQLRIFDGTRNLFSAPIPFLITITDGNRIQRFRNYCQKNDVTFDLPFFDNNGDNYTVVVWANGYKQAGFAPVILSDKYVRTLDIMLISDSPGFSFVDARWEDVSTRYPFLGSDLDQAEGKTRYDNFLDKEEKSLACLLNLSEAMSQIHLSQGTPLDYIKYLHWEAPYAPAQDRFFAWCDCRLIDQIKVAADARMFSAEINPGLFHTGATSSWKQIQYGEANVQLTFHEKDKMVIGGVDCVMVEPDIDYFRDLGAHGIFEVVPNALTHSLTNPTDVYVLRWIAGRAAGVPEFSPRYTITS